MCFPRRIPDAETYRLQKLAEGVGGKIGGRRLVGPRVACEYNESPADLLGKLPFAKLAVGYAIVGQTGSAHIPASQADGRVQSELVHEIPLDCIDLAANEVPRSAVGSAAIANAGRREPQLICGRRAH